MTTAFAIALTLGIPTLCGYIIVSALLCHEYGIGPLERVAVGFGLGLGLLSVFTFLASLAGASLSRPYFYLIQITYTVPFIVAYGLSMRTRRDAAGPDSRSMPALGGAGSHVLAAAGTLVIIWLAAKAGFVLFEGLNRPLYADDNWSNWSAGAKLFYYQGSLMLDPGSEHFFGRGYRLYLGHPLLTPIAEVWTAVNLGRFDEILVKAWSPFYYIATVALLYFAVSRDAGRGAALASAFMLSTAPLLTFHALDGYADLPLSFYVLAGGVFLWRYMERGGGGSLMASGLLFGIGGFTKNEGMLYLFFAAAALFAHIALTKGGRWSESLYYILPGMAILPWVIFKLVNGIGYGHHDEAGGLHWINEIHLEIFPIYLKELFYHVNHGLIIPFVVVVTVLGYKTVLRTKIKYLYMIFVPTFCVFLFLYMTTMDFESVTERTASNRNTITFIPLALYAATLVAARLLSPPLGTIERASSGGLRKSRRARWREGL